LITPVIGYHSDNLLGTVSQSAGVPTGAVIESGTGFVRFADGTMVLDGYYTTSGTGTSTLTLGKTFISSAYSIVGSSNPSNSESDITVKFSGRAASSVEVTTTVNGAKTAPVAISYIAIGRWFA